MTDYVPPKVWTWDQPSGGQFASINRPIAGATHDQALPVGKHPFQLYSLATPNGQKVAIMLEELLERGHDGAEYDAWPIRIGEGDQFSSGFVAINPNSKIPALVDRSGSEPVRVFESGAILIHLAETFGEFLPASGPERAETLSWLFWQMGSAPFLGGGFALGRTYEGADEFLATHEYEHLQRWAKQVDARPAVKRGRMVNRVSGDPASQLHERHDASDFETKTQDKIAPAM